MADPKLLELTAKIVTSHLSNNPISPDDLPLLIEQVYNSLTAAATPPQPPQQSRAVVPINRSVFEDHIVCLICGGHFRTLRHHLNREHALSAEEYRAKFQLPAQYPLVAPGYREERSRIAREIRLGHNKLPRLPAPETQH